MVGKLRVWTGFENKQRLIVAATSRRRAIILLDSTPDEFNEWYTETRDPTELSVATREGVWDSTVSSGRSRTIADFKPWHPPELLRIVFPACQISAAGKDLEN